MGKQVLLHVFKVGLNYKVVKNFRISANFDFCHTEVGIKKYSIV